MEDNAYLNAAMDLHDAYKANDLEAAQAAVAILNTNSNNEFLHQAYNIMTECGEVFPNSVYGYVITNLNSVDNRELKLLSYNIYQINSIPDLAERKAAAAEFFNTTIGTKAAFDALNLTKKSMLLQFALQINLTPWVNTIRSWLQAND